ncbi:hypothetical protein HMPREF9099_02325 [Lachnospiraceae bacterium oral taxon 082 str. F0431]|nr:hypothetical protein HMPREF9099_02325 [Lachnospiraceae bacterium oral taxon 082 str. F0431]
MKVFLRNIVFFYKYCYTYYVVVSQSDNRLDVKIMSIAVSFIVSLSASIVAYYICKWIDKK